MGFSPRNLAMTSINVCIHDHTCTFCQFWWYRTCDTTATTGFEYCVKMRSQFSFVELDISRRGSSAAERRLSCLLSDQSLLKKMRVDIGKISTISINLLVVYRESVNLIGYITRRLSADSLQLWIANEKRLFWTRDACFTPQCTSRAVFETFELPM